MTIDKFNNTKFHVGMKVIYRDGETYDIVSIDFDEALIGVKGIHEIQWKRCENCEII